MVRPREDWSSPRHRLARGAPAPLLMAWLTTAGCGPIQRLITPPPPRAQGYEALAGCIAHIDALSAYRMDIRTSFPRGAGYTMARSNDLVAIATGSGQTARATQFDPAAARERVETRGT